MPIESISIIKFTMLIHTNDHDVLVTKSELHSLERRRVSCHHRLFTNNFHTGSLESAVETYMMATKLKNWSALNRWTFLYSLLLYKGEPERYWLRLADDLFENEPIWTNIRQMLDSFSHSCIAFALLIIPSMSTNT